MDVPFQHKLRGSFSFRKTVREINPDITIYTWVMGAFLAAFSGWKGKCIYEAHRARPTMKHQWIMSLMEGKVDAVVTLTQQDAKESYTPSVLRFKYRISRLFMLKSLLTARQNIV